MSRKAYGLQITTLGCVYTEVLQLNKDCMCAIRISNILTAIKDCNIFN